LKGTTSQIAERLLACEEVEKFAKTLSRDEVWERARLHRLRKNSIELHFEVARQLLGCRSSFGVAQRFSAAVSTLLCFAAFSRRGKLRPAEQFFRTLFSRAVNGAK
jgi:hypothetical protein